MRPPVPGPNATQAEIEAYVNWMNAHQMARGTPYVPRNMLAYLHKGEAVIPASMNNMGTGGIRVHGPLQLVLPNATNIDELMRGIDWGAL